MVGGVTVRETWRFVICSDGHLLGTTRLPTSRPTPESDDVLKWHIQPSGPMMASAYRGGMSCGHPLLLTQELELTKAG